MVEAIPWTSHFPKKTTKSSAHMKEHLKTTLNVLNPVAGTNFLAAEEGLNRKVFWCLFVVQFFVFLADATKENA